MTELEKYELINSAETTQQLQDAIMKIAGEEGIIKGRKRDWPAIKQAGNVKLVIAGYPANILTRSYGIRQQALYLKYYLL